MGAKKIEQRITQLIADQFNLDIEAVTRDTRFIEDLNADSLDHVELVMEAEDEFDIAIADEEAERWATVGEVIDFIEKVTK